MSDTAVIFSILAKDGATSTLGKIGKAAAGMFAMFASAKLIEFGKDAIDAASDLAETQSKVNVLFGSGSTQVQRWAATADRALGQSQQQALDAAATFATFGKSAGLTGARLTGFSTNLAGLASDMASFSNTTPDDAINAIGAALRGEMEPIRRYGVLLDDASLRQQALGMHLIKTTTQALTPQQKVLAAQALILKQTTAAQGDFARTSTGAANAARIQAAESENLKVKIGQGLLPTYIKAQQVLLGLTNFVSQHADWVVPLAVGIAAIVVGVKLWTMAQWMLNFAMDANPIGLIILAIVAVVAVIAILWMRSAAFRNFFIGLWGHIWGFLKGVGEWFAGPFAQFFVRGWKFLMDLVGGYYAFLINTFNRVVGFVASLPGRISRVASGMWDGIKHAFRAAINWVLGRWNSLRFTIPAVNFLGIHVPGFTLGVPPLPYLATGGTATSGGMAMVGERGPEMVYLPTGASVVPLDRTAGRRTEVRFAGNTDTAFATAFMNLVRGGQIQITTA